MVTITGLDDFPAALSVFPLPLADGRTALACVHMPTPGTAEVAYSAAYVVDSLGRAAKIGESERYGKDIACAVKIVNTGYGAIFELYVTEPPPFGGGAASALHRYDFAIAVGVDFGIAALDARLDRIAQGAQG